MIRRILSRRSPYPRYSCYWVALHFASAEDAARYLKEQALPARIYGRLLRGGETVPICQMYASVEESKGLSEERGK